MRKQPTYMQKHSGAFLHSTEASEIYALLSQHIPFGLASDLAVEIAELLRCLPKQREAAPKQGCEN